MLAILLLSIGVGLFGVFTSHRATIFLTPRDHQQEAPDFQGEIKVFSDKIEHLERLLNERKSAE